MTAETTGAGPEVELDSRESETTTRQYVTFLVGGEAFAVDMSPVREIIRVPEVVRVPLAPPSLDGLSNLRGRVLPIISLRRIFGFAEQEHDDSTRAVVIDLGQALGFVVDRVASVVEVEADQVRDVEGIRGTIDSDLLKGLLRDAAGFAMVMVLDFAKLIEREFAQIARIGGGGAASTAREKDGEAEEQAASDELQLVSFSLAGQDYAIDIENVQEIVQIPGNIVHVPNSPPHVTGLMTLREQLLPLVSLRDLFGLPASALDERSRIVVVSQGGTAVGVVTDSVSEVLRVPRSIVDDMPALLAGGGGAGDIASICRIDGGKRLVSIVSARNMFRLEAVRGALEVAEGMETKSRTRPEDDEDRLNDDEEQVVVFRLAEGEFGAPIESVQEIVRVPERLTRVPKAPPFVEGVINLRGTVLPVIDQRRRLGLESIERNDRQRIMVFLLAGVRTGFIVDAVSEVLKIPRNAIEPAPRLSDDQRRLLGRVANLEKEKRMIQLVDPEHLVDDKDRKRLSEVAPNEGGRCRRS